MSSRKTKTEARQYIRRIEHNNRLMVASMSVGGEPNWDTINESMALLQQNQEYRKQRWLRKIAPLTENEWMRQLACEEWVVDGHTCWMSKPPIWEEMERASSLIGKPLVEVGYCGYVLFEQKPVVEPSYKGILNYVPVHGGITFANHDGYGSLYGFDTCHHNSSAYPNRDPEWIKFQVWLMLEGIKLASTLEDAYLRADGDNQERARILQPLVNLAPEGDWWNMGLGINLLSGEL